VTLTAGLAIGLCASTGLTLALGLSVIRRRREVASINTDLAKLLEHDGALGRKLDAVCDEVRDLKGAIRDAQRRWGFDLSRFPHVEALVSDLSPAEGSHWLIEHAPGIRNLRPGGRATESFFEPTYEVYEPVYESAEGWRPPSALVGSNGR
jgi:hypothetical protein